MTLDQKTASPQRPWNFIRFLAFVRPYLKFVAAAAIGGIVKFGVPLLVPQVTRYLLDDVYLNPALSAAGKTHELVTYVGGMMLIFIFFWAPLTYVRHYYAGKASQRAIFDLRSALYDHVLRLSASFFDRNKSGALVSRLVGDVELAQDLIGSALTDTWMDFVSLALILFFLLRIQLGVSLAALVTFPIYLYFFRKSQSDLRRSSVRVQEGLATMAGNIQEKITGNRVVRSFAQETHEQKRFHSESESLYSIAMHRIYLQSVNVVTTSLLTYLAPLIVTLYGGYQVILGHLTIGEFVAVGMYLPSLYTPLQRFAQLNLVFANSMAAVDRVFEIMDQEPEIHDQPGALELPSIAGRVEFTAVDFAYHHVQEPGPVLRNITFVAEPGQKVALVGPSGAGKSTVVSLIPRFYDVDAGAVSIDGHDVRALSVTSLRQQVGMVLQTPILFSGSVLDNIRYGKPTATLDEIMAACRAANAYDFIRNMRDGFESEVGEGGTLLSGGQKQRITIARAFLKNPRILILDEATSSLDSESEKLIQAALERLVENRTTLIIAHRLSTVKHVDCILVMENGRIVETGTHAELVRANGLYQRLYA
jgi:ABC-type multidrug transport system fused ATPase/permease subunit